MRKLGHFTICCCAFIIYIHFVFCLCNILNYYNQGIKFSYLENIFIIVISVLMGCLVFAFSLIYLTYLHHPTKLSSNLVYLEIIIFFITVWFVIIISNMTYDIIHENTVLPWQKYHKREFGVCWVPLIVFAYIRLKDKIMA